MQCKHHPGKKAEHFCSSCGIPLCSACAEEVTLGSHFCFQCAMFQTVSGVGTSLKDKRQKSAAKKQGKKDKNKWGPFHYFVVACSVLIVVMWGVIIFGGQKAPVGASNFASNMRAFLFMIDGSIKRYAHYEGGKYPDSLNSLVPKYLTLGDQDRPLLDKLSYQKNPRSGYRLTLANPKPGEMVIIISPQGIEHQKPSGQGA
jgi:hypothetical protein